MSAADEAYAAAKDVIRVANDSDATELSLSGSAFYALASLPPEIEGLRGLRVLRLTGTSVADLGPISALTALRTLHLNRTGVVDLTPLRGLTALWLLDLSRTRVTDVTPLRGLTALWTLNLNRTWVADLTPLRDLTELRTLTFDRTPVANLRPIAGHISLIDGAQIPSNRGVSFKRSAACRLDPEGLGRLAAIDDNEERTRKTLEYLQNLTVWPPGSPDERTEADAELADIEVPEQDEALRVAPNPETGGRLDVHPGTPSAEEAAERLKQRLYARLRTTLNALATATGNRHYTITQRVTAFRGSLPDDLAEADLLAVYLELDWLRGIHDRRAERQGEDRLPEAAVESLHEIATVGPGLVLGNAAVDRLEERRRDFELGPRAPAAEAAHDALSKGIAQDENAFAPTLRRYARQTVGGSDTPGSRREVAQRILNRNTLIAIGTSVATAPVTGPIGAATYDAIVWVVTNHEVALAAARTFGATYFAWLSPLLSRAAQIVAAVESSGIGPQIRGTTSRRPR